MRPCISSSGCRNSGFTAPSQGAGIIVLSMGGWDTHSSALGLQTQHYFCLWYSFFFGDHFSLLLDLVPRLHCATSLFKCLLVFSCLVIFVFENLSSPTSWGMYLPEAYYLFSHKYSLSCLILWVKVATVGW
jgi:hypothetical protein